MFTAAFPPPRPELESVVGPADGTTAARQAAKAPMVMSLALAGSDFVTLTVAVLLGFLIWHWVNPDIPPLHPVLLMVSSFCVAEFAFSGHYPGIGMIAVEHMRRVCRGVTFVYLLFTAAMFLTKDSGANSRGGLFLAWIISLVMAPLGRWLTSQALISRSLWGVPVVMIGAGKTARTVIRNLNANKVLGYRAVACLDDDFASIGSCEGVPVLGALSDAAAICAQTGAQYAIFAVPGMSNEQFVWNLRRWSRIFPKILIIPNLSGLLSLWTEPRDLGGVLGLEMRQNLLDKWNQRIKRAMDVVVSFLGLVAVAPLIALCAVWIKIVSPGNAFYSQEREGKDGRPIRVLKLRTMYPNAERTLQEYLAQNPAAAVEWELYCKLKKDPRILPLVGHFLRKSSVDELPQLWNIFKGEMSLVGPRPFPAHHNARFHPEFRSVRIQVTPGLTGLWQVSARSNGNLEVQEALDSYYIRNWSLWLDLYILIRTIRAVFLQEGSY
jgi:Undecaprenyl-phosphate galactose phosphotransferase WbaP